MPNFGKMTLTELIKPEGYACSCGKVHTCGLKYLNIGRGIIDDVPAMVRAMGKAKPFVVCDGNTWDVAGKRVDEALTKAGVEHISYVIPCVNGESGLPGMSPERISPAEWEVGSVIMAFDPSCDMFLAVGSGVVNDICKVAAKATGRPSAVVGTAPSMDGYASNNAAMEKDHVKISLYTAVPQGILLDTDVLAQAPMRMLWAGLGDMVAKYIAICEWRISNLVTGEYYCEDVAGLMRAALEKIMAASDKIAKRDPDAIGSVAEGLVLAGIGMAYAEISRPASGLEHYFSHMWEMMALERNEPYDLHGIQVGIGTVLTMKIYEKLVTIKPDRAKAEAHMAAFDRGAWEAQIRRVFGKTADQIIAIEDRVHKNDPAAHAVRLNRIIENWDEILKIIREELPDIHWLCDAMAATGMPMTPKDIGVSDQDVLDAYIGSRDIRDKYLSCSVIWDLGMTDEFVDYLKTCL